MFFFFDPNNRLILGIVDLMRFLPCHVNVTKCLSEKKQTNKQTNKQQSITTKIFGLREHYRSPCDAYTM